MAFKKSTRESAWHQALVREDDFNNALAKLSLIKKGIKNPTSLQLRIETLFLSHKSIDDTIFLSELSGQEFNCLLLAAWGLEIEETAKLLGIREDSVNKNRSSISQKLITKNITHSVYKANQAGILTVDNVDFLLQPKEKKKITIGINKKIGLENDSI